ncbi:hypothetical protein lerEdw1_018974 [Lerista edwardsae]|nr:hypothetical protein lerEdw1_018974 [Lerista edwardsae]
MEDNPENASSAADNVTEPTSALDDLTEPPCTPNDATDPLDRDEETHLRTKPRVERDGLHPSLAAAEGEMIDGWVQIEQPNHKQGCALAKQLEKMRLDMALTMTRFRYEDKEKQRQHEEKMEEMRLQNPSIQAPGGGHNLLLPQDQFTLFLYCFIFIHIIYIARELMFFFIKKHEMFAIGAILMCAIKTFWK